MRLFFNFASYICVVEGLLFHIWYSLVAHLKNVLEHGNKKDGIEVFTKFLSSFQEIVSAQSLEPTTVLVTILHCSPNMKFNVTFYFQDNFLHIYI